MAKPIRKLLLPKMDPSTPADARMMQRRSVNGGGEFITILEDGHRAWKAATVMGKVRKAGRMTKHVALASLEEEQQGIVMELAVHGPSVEREMPGWVEAGG